jgi:hypothetical protein
VSAGFPCGRARLLGAPALDRLEVRSPPDGLSLGFEFGKLRGLLEHDGQSFERRSQPSLEIYRRGGGMLRMGTGVGDGHEATLTLLAGITRRW